MRTTRLLQKSLRLNNNIETIKSVDAEAFDKILSSIYSGGNNSSESVMADIKDFVDMESAADLEETEIFLTLKMMRQL